MPRKGVPVRVGQRYFREIRTMAEEDRKRTWEAWENEIKPRLKRIREQRQNVSANSELWANALSDEVQDVLRRLREEALGKSFSEGVVARKAANFVREVDRRVWSLFKDQFKRVKGIDPTDDASRLAEIRESIIQENVSYIRSIPEEHHTDIEGVINRGLRRGTSLNDMAHEISRVGHTSISRGRFIARDQLGSVYGDLTRERHQNAGLEKFRWITAADERVRDSHEPLHNKVFSWRDGATNERGETIWPGTDYNCRCIAEIYEPDLEEEEDEGAA